MQLTARSSKIMVSADGTGIVSQAGGLLLTQTLRVTGLDRGLPTALERWRPARAVHGPGKIITDLAVALALGGVITRSTPAECRRLRSCSVVELCSDGLLLNVSALATSWTALLLPRSLWLEWVSAAVTDALANLGSCGRLVRDAFPAILYGVMNTFTLI